jgi:hypothetical protein
MKPTLKEIEIAKENAIANSEIEGLTISPEDIAIEEIYKSLETTDQTNHSKETPTKQQKNNIL